MSHPSTITGCRDIQRNGKWRSNVNVKCRIVDVSLNISASSSCRRIKLPPFVMARWDGSNELRYILLRSLDVEIIDILILYWIWISSVWFSSIQFGSVQFSFDSVSNQISFKSDQISSNQFESNQFQIKSVSNQISFESNQIKSDLI